MAAKKKIKLQAEKRKLTGRKVKKLRQESILPANIYGKKIKSQAVQLALKDFLPVYQEVGETGLVDLKIKGETKVRPVLIHNVQVHPVTDQPLHTDLYQVSLKEKVTTEIPVELVGESPAVKEKVGILVHLIDEIEVEALPTELPDKFEVDLGSLEKVGNMINVSTLKPPKGVTILTGSKQVLVKIEPPTKKEEEAPPTEKEPVEGEEAPEEAVEAPAEGEKAAEAVEKPAAKPSEGASKPAPSQQSQEKK